MVELIDDPKAPSVFLHVRVSEAIAVLHLPYSNCRNL